MDLGGFPKIEITICWGCWGHWGPDFYGNYYLGFRT